MGVLADISGLPLGLALRELRQQREKNLADIAWKIGMSPSALAKKERGELSISTLELRQLAEALGTEVQAVINRATTIAGEHASIQDAPRSVRHIAVGQAITKLRESKKISQERLGELVGLSQESISRREKGTTPTPAAERKKIAVALGSTIEEFDALWRAAKVHDRPAPPGIPVINKGPAGNVQPYDHSHYSAGEYHQAWEYVDRLGIDDEHAFALIIEGDSMAPALTEGDYVVFTPMSVPKPRATLRDGDVVFVRISEDAPRAGVSVGRWFAVDAETVRIQKDNPRYPALTVRREHITQLAKGIQHRRSNF
jgi:transcriptional regulator with XRE-family HTH domain